MSLPLPTNCTLKVQRDGQDVVGLTSLPAVVIPARPETIALREVPAGEAFEIYFYSYRGRRTSITPSSGAIRMTNSG